MHLTRREFLKLLLLTPLVIKLSGAAGGFAPRRALGGYKEARPPLKFLPPKAAVYSHSKFEKPYREV
jgi:hypothetical protein